MGIKTRHFVGRKVRARCRCLNQISSDNMESFSFENSPFGLKNTSLSAKKQSDVFYGFGTTPGLSEGNVQPHVVPLIMLVGQPSAVHIPGAGLVPAFVLGNAPIDINTGIGPCQWTNGTNMPYNSVYGISQLPNVASKNWYPYKKERCCCESFKDICLEEKVRDDQETETTQSAYSKFNSAGDSYHQNVFETTCSGGTGIIKFEPPILTDYIIKNNQTREVAAKLQCITALQNYEKKSLEELRLEDYLVQNKANPAVNSSEKPTFGKPVSNFTFGLSTASTGQPLTSITTNNLPSTTAAGINIFGQPPITSFGNSKSDFPFGQPLISNTANNIPAMTSTTGTSIFGQQTMTSFGQPKSDFPFGQPLIFGITSNIPTTTTSTSTTATSVFGQPNMTSFGNPKSDFTFGQPLISGTSNSTPTMTTKTSTGASVFGQPTMTSFGNPKSDFPFGQPLISNTTNNIPATTSTTGTSIFGQQTMTSFGKPKSDFPFGQPLKFGSTSNIPTTTTSTSTTATSVFGQPTMTSSGNPKSDFTFGLPLISGTSNSTPTTTTTTSTGTSIFGQPTMTSVGKPKSNFSFGQPQPLIFGITSNIPTTTNSTSTTSTSFFGQSTMTSFGKPKSDFTFGHPLACGTSNSTPTTTTSTSTTATGMFGESTFSFFDKKCSNVQFGQTSTSTTTNNLPTTTSSAININNSVVSSNSSADKSNSGFGFKFSSTSNTALNPPSTTSTATSFGSLKPKMLYTKPGNVKYDVATMPSSTSSPATGIITAGTPLSSSSNNVLNSAAHPKTTSIFGHLTVNKNPETNSIEPISKSTTKFGSQSISTACLGNSKAEQQITGIFGQQMESKCVPPPTPPSSAKSSTTKPVCGFRFDQPAAGGLFNRTEVQRMVTDGFFTQQTSPKSYPSTNLSSIQKPFFMQTPRNGFSKPNAGFSYQAANNRFPSATQVFPGLATGPFSTPPWKSNNLFHANVTEKPATSSNLFNKVTFGPSQTSQEPWHFNNVCSCNKPRIGFQQSSNLGLQHGTTNSASFAFERANSFQQGFQANLQQQQNTSPFVTATTNTTQPSFFSQSNHPSFGEIPSIAVICYMPGNAFCSTGPVMNNVFGNLEQNPANWMGSMRSPYYSTFENDPVSKLPIKSHCITRMKEYENKSVEEIRFEDYLIKNKNQQAEALRLIGQVQSALTQLFRGINNKPMNNSFGQQTEDLGFAKSANILRPSQFNDHITLF